MSSCETLFLNVPSITTKTGVWLHSDRHLEVDLLPNLPLNFSRVTCEQRKEALLSGVDDIDLVKRHLTRREQGCL